MAEDRSLEGLRYLQARGSRSNLEVIKFRASSLVNKPEVIEEHDRTARCYRCHR